MIGFNYIASPGDLGNQMFKYAALRGIAKSNEQDFLIPPSYLKLEKYKTIYKLFSKVVNPKVKQNHQLFNCFNMTSVSKQNIGYIETSNIVRENNFHFEPKFFSLNYSDCEVIGYFQSEKYFLNVTEIIKSDFQFKESIEKKTNSYIEKLDNPVSIHIRRGDYLINPNHSTLSMDYYTNALGNFKKNRNFLIFSDDIEWCREQEVFNAKNFIFSDEITNNLTFLDLCLMSKCKDHIIANSTFSWWGAWLSDYENVYAPKSWFPKSRSVLKDTKDLFPSNWQLIEN